MTGPTGIAAHTSDITLIPILGYNIIIGTGSESITPGTGSIQIMSLNAGSFQFTYRYDNLYLRVGTTYIYTFSVLTYPNGGIMDAVIRDAADTTNYHVMTSLNSYNVTGSRLYTSTTFVFNPPSPPLIETIVKCSFRVSSTTKSEASTGSRPKWSSS